MQGASQPGLFPEHGDLLLFGGLVEVRQVHTFNRSFAISSRASRLVPCFAW
jgi:hypothetical protein